MPTGTPDFNQKPSGNLSSPGFDSSEETTRLLMGGGAQARGGRWIWATGFENGLAEIVCNGAAGSAGALETGDNQVYQGAASLKLTTNNAVNGYRFLHKTLFSQGENFGLEIVWSAEDAAAGAVEISFRISGANESSGNRGAGKIVIVINGASSGEIYIDNNGTRTLIQSIDNYLEDNPDNWHYTKIIYNFKKNILSRVYFDDLIFTLNVPGYLSADSRKVCLFQVELKTLTARAAVAYFDNMIITTDEP
jgi:hypothetical protein